MAKGIPIHDFSEDTHDSIPFGFLSLDAQSNYDTSEPHRHNYYEIFFFSTGGGSHTIDFEKVPIKDRSIHCLSPGQVHLLQRTPEARGSILLFSRDFYYLNSDSKNNLFDFSFLNNNNIVPVTQVNDVDFATICQLLELIKQENHALQKTKPAILTSYLHLILLKCAHFFEGTHQANGQDGKDVFRQLQGLVEKKYREEKQPSAYAMQLYITEKKLNEICKQHTGRSLGDFIKNRVLLEAKRLLANSDYTVKEISYFLGFDDPSYFNRFFKINAGSTAGGFRVAKQIRP